MRKRSGRIMRVKRMAKSVKVCDPTSICIGEDIGRGLDDNCIRRTSRQ